MDKRLLFLILLCSLLKQQCIAQNYNQTIPYLKGNSVWAFGKGAGYNFNTHTAFTTPLQSEEGCASVCNRTTGNLLFFSDGKSAWNKNSVVMTQANANLLGNNMNFGTTAQGVCIVPFINDPNKYYLFSLQPQGGSSLTGSKGKLYYSVVDMTLSAGLGNVVSAQRNILVDSFLGEGMIAIPGNNCDIWLMVHKEDTALFKAYHITAAGIDMNAVCSNTGTQIKGSSTYTYTWGTLPTNYVYKAYMINSMAVSPDRSKIAIATSIPSFGNLTSYSGLVKGSMLFDFNPSTGSVSNAILMDTVRCYGVSFSPDNSKLYISTTETPMAPLATIAQYELTTYNAAAINASRTVVTQLTNGAYGLKLYNDTIYVAYGNSSGINPFVHRINNPNLTGVAANFQANAIVLSPNSSCNFNLNNNVVYPSPPDTTSTTHLDTMLCEAAWQTMTLQTNTGYSAYLWDDGSTASTRTISQNGTYWVLCKDACHSVIDSFHIRALPPDTTGQVSLDTTICKTFTGLMLTASPGYYGYQWNDGSTGNTKEINDWGTYWVLCKDSCHSLVDTFHVKGADMAFDLGNDTNVCNTHVVALKVRIDNAGYLWQDGTTDQMYNVQSPGTYSVTVNKNGCSASDNITIRYIDIRQALGNDTAYCYGDHFTLPLYARTPDGSRIKWSTGATENDIMVRDTGSYFVTVTNEQCSGTDTIRVGYIICECSYLMPTAFTPNNDGVNDFYKPALQPGCTVTRYSLNIYNRYGQRVYSGTHPDAGWDGSFHDGISDVGTYYYELSFEGGSRKIQYYQKGDFSLIR
jgi:gliding motility-associated-like protein